MRRKTDTRYSPSRPFCDISVRSICAHYEGGERYSRKRSPSRGGASDTSASGGYGGKLLKGADEKANEAAGILHIQIAGGHTEVSENCSVPYVTATAIGSVEGEALFENHIRPGQDIVLTGQVGCEGAGLLATRYEERLAERYPLHMIEKAQAFLQELSILPEAATAIKSNAGAMHDVSGGGIFASLWELAESAGVGLAVDLKAIPIRQECVEVCEFFGISPYEMLSGGSLLITTDNGEHLVRDLKEAGILAAVIGKITDNNDRVVINQEEKRFLDRPVSDEFSKIKGENL